MYLQKSKGLDMSQVTEDSYQILSTLCFPLNGANALLLIIRVGVSAGVGWGVSSMGSRCECST